MGIGQTDLAPRPPLSWMTILGGLAVVGVTVAIFGGTAKLRGVRANRRRARRRVSRNTKRRSVRRNTGTRNWYRSGGLYRQGNWAWDGSGVEGRGDLLWWNATLVRFSPVAEDVTLDEANGVISKSPLWTWDSPKSNGRRSSRRMRSNGKDAWRDSGGTIHYGDWVIPYGRESTRFTTKAEADKLVKFFSTHYGPGVYGAKVVREPSRSRRGEFSYQVYIRSLGAMEGLTKRTRRNPRKPAKPKRAKFSDVGVFTAAGVVRDAHPREHHNLLPQGTVAKLKRMPPGLYKVGYGPKRGEVIQAFPKASLLGAITSSRIAASKSHEYHYVVDNFDPRYPVVIRGIDDAGKTFFRVEDYAQQFAHERVAVRRGYA